MPANQRRTAYASQISGKLHLPVKMCYWLVHLMGVSGGCVILLLHPSVHENDRWVQCCSGCRCGLVLLELDAAPVVDRVVGNVGEAGVLGHSDDHRHVFHIEAADEEQTFAVETERVGRNVLEKDVSVDVREDDIVSVPLEEGSVTAACLDSCADFVESCVVIGRNRSNRIDVDSVNL